MRRNGIANAAPAARPVRRPKRRPLLTEPLLASAHGHFMRRHPLFRAFTIAAAVLLTVGAGTTGFAIGAAKDADALSRTAAAAGAEHYASTAASDEALNQRIEKINVQKTVDEQSKEIDQLQNQIDDYQRNFQKNILDALMRNMNTKLSSSRSATGYRYYVSQAKVLVSLYNKVVKFKKTAVAKTVDISAYSNEVSARLSHLPTLRPIPGSYSGYGWRIHPIYHIRQFHPADDIGAPYGTSIKAAGAGTVTYAAYNRGGGNMVTIDHGNGFQTIYMHMSSMKVKAGQKVSKGQIIGKVGSTGTSTTPHLHFEVHYHGTPFNPTEILLQW